MESSPLLSKSIEPLPRTYTEMLEIPSTPEQHLKKKKKKGSRRLWTTVMNSVVAVLTGVATVLFIYFFLLEGTFLGWMAGLGRWAEREREQRESRERAESREPSF